MNVAIPRFLKRHPRACTLGLVLVVALADYASGLEISFVELMYLVPVAFATWFVNRSAGLVIAGIAAAILTAITLNEAPGAVGATLLNGVGALGIFLAIVWLVSLLRLHFDREAARLHSTVEQLRHAERLNVLGVLAAGVAHELGTPLNVISGAAEMLDEGEPSHAKSHEMSQLILGQTERITGIVQNLLGFARRGQTAKSPVALDPIVTSAVDMLAATARKRGATIELRVASGARPIRANRQELEQVVSNLILNGIQAMSRGGRITVETCREERTDSDGRVREYGTIVVEDEGTGIAPTDLPHIFDPFFTTKGVGEGTGLGLSVTYGIVADLGGSIDVATEVGRGTRFVVRIPLAP